MAEFFKERIKDRNQYGVYPLIKNGMAQGIAIVWVSKKSCYSILNIDFGDDEIVTDNFSDSFHERFKRFDYADPLLIDKLMGIINQCIDCHSIKIIELIAAAKRGGLSIELYESIESVPSHSSSDN